MSRFVLVVLAIASAIFGVVLGQASLGVAATFGSLGLFGLAAVFLGMAACVPPRDREDEDVPFDL